MSRFCNILLFILMFGTVNCQTNECQYEHTEEEGDPDGDFLMVCGNVCLYCFDG